MALISRIVPNRWLRLLLATVLLSVAGYLLWRQGTAYSELRAARADAARYKFVEADDHLRKCLEIWPSRTDVWLLAGQVARRREDYVRAEFCYDRVQQLNSGQSTDELNFERLLLQAQLDPDGRMDFLRPLVENHDPRSLLILEAMVRGYLQRHRYVDARLLVGLWLERKPDDAYALLCRGAVRDQIGPRNECVVDFRRVLELDPDQVEARLWLSQALLSLAQPGEALEAIRPLAVRFPNEPKVLATLAECEEAVGESTQAEATARKVLALQPDNEEAMILLGKCLINRDQFDEAEVHLRAVLKIRPSLFQARMHLHRLLVTTKRDKEAAEAKILMEQSMTDSVRLMEVFKEALPKSPRNPALYLEVGQIFLRAREPATAMHWLSDGLRYAESSPGIQRQLQAELANVQEQLGRTIPSRSANPDRRPE